MTSAAPASRIGPWTLYRLFAEAGVLLYAGHSRRPGGRLADHEAKEPWWPEVRSVSFETYPTKAAAYAAEVAAIKAECPVHNRMRYRWQGPVRAPVPVPA